MLEIFTCLDLLAREIGYDRDEDTGTDVEPFWAKVRDKYTEESHSQERAAVIFLVHTLCRLLDMEPSKLDVIDFNLIHNSIKFQAIKWREAIEQAKAQQHEAGGH